MARYSITEKWYTSRVGASEDAIEILLEINTIPGAMKYRFMTLLSDGSTIHMSNDFNESKFQAMKRLIARAELLEVME